jgi:hypothetical protein
MLGLSLLSQLRLKEKLRPISMAEPELAVRELQLFSGVLCTARDSPESPPR